MDTLPAVGDTVRITERGSFHGVEGRVMQVGECTYVKCRHGKRCVEVRIPSGGGYASINRSPDAMEILTP